MRFIAPHPSTPESRRVALFEKAVDVAATCPYARSVNRWVLAGLGSGARVAALAAPRVRSLVAGYVFLSYPLRVSGRAVWWAGGWCGCEGLGEGGGERGGREAGE